MSYLETIRENANVCHACGLDNLRVFAKGPEDSSIMIIGEAPGVQEIREGEPFVGPAGKVLRTHFEKYARFDINQCYVTNVCKCHPIDNKTPSLEEIKICSTFLEQQIATIRPKLLVLLGNTALTFALNYDKDLLASLSYKGVDEKNPRITQCSGKHIESDGHIWFPLLHPAALLHNNNYKDSFIEHCKNLSSIIGGMDLSVEKASLEEWY